MFVVGEFLYNPETLVICRFSVRKKKSFVPGEKEVARDEKGVRKCKYRIVLSFSSSEDVRKGKHYDVTSKKMLFRK